MASQLGLRMRGFCRTHHRAARCADPVAGDDREIQISDSQNNRHCERSEAIHCRNKKEKRWIASLRSQ
jgi:hypothetical protein